MKKILFTILALLILPQVSFGATLFEQGTEFTYSINYNASGGYGMISPAGTGAVYGADENAVWYTVTATSTLTIRLKPITTSSCALIASSLYLRAGTNALPDSYVITGDYCDINYGTIVTGETLKAFDYASDTASPMYGENVGYSWTGTGTPYPYTFGFWAFDSGGITPPASTFTLTQPTASSYASNPITFAGNYYMNGTACYSQIEFETRALNASSTPIFGLVPITIPFSQCYGSEQAGNATTTFNLPFQGTWETRGRMSAFNTASSTAWSSWVQFAIGTTTVAVDSPIGGYVPQDCDWNDIGCGIKNALGWAFIPDSDVVDKFEEAKFFEDKAPFVYATQLPGLYDNFANATATASTSFALEWTMWGGNKITIWNLGTWPALPFWSLIFGSMVAITYLMFATGVWFRVRNIHTNDKI